MLNFCYQTRYKLTKLFVNNLIIDILIFIINLVMLKLLNRL